MAMLGDVAGMAMFCDDDVLQTRSSTMPMFTMGCSLRGDDGDDDERVDFDFAMAMYVLACFFDSVTTTMAMMRFVPR